MKHCRDCRHLDLEQKSSIGCVCTNNNRKRPVKKNLGHIKQPSARACKTGFEPREEVKIVKRNRESRARIRVFNYLKMNKKTAVCS